MTGVTIAKKSDKLLRKEINAISAKKAAWGFVIKTQL